VATGVVVTREKEWPSPIASTTTTSSFFPPSLSEREKVFMALYICRQHRSCLSEVRYVFPLMPIVKKADSSGRAIISVTTPSFGCMRD
jgi:hypothetical protein